MNATHRISLLVLSLAACLLGTACGADISDAGDLDLSGNWALHPEGSSVSIPLFIDIVQDGMSVEGSGVNRDGDSFVVTGTVDGENIQMIILYSGQASPETASATLSGDSMDGTWTSGDTSVDWTATKQA